MTNARTLLQEKKNKVLRFIITLKNSENCIKRKKMNKILVNQ